MSMLRLLDISGLFWPIWRVKEAKGEPIGAAAEETIRMLRERAGARDADYVVACCDAGRSFRWEVAEEYRELLPEYPGYKGHRPDKDPAMMHALDRVVSEIEADGIPVFRAPGFEADDVIATLAQWAVENGMDVEIVSDDKDLRQLVSDPEPEEHRPFVRVVKRDGEIVNEAAVLAKFGVPPQRLADWLAMAGDVGDGVKGVPGIGGDTAAALLWGHYDKDRRWHPTPFRTYAEMHKAAVDDQAAVEANERELARARENKAARALVKQGDSHEAVAAKLGITAEMVGHYCAFPVERLPQFPKPRFKDSTRKALIAGERWFDISLRLTLLRTDVPLDFAQVTKPREPKRDPGKEAERSELLARAAAAAEEDERALIEAAQEALSQKDQETMNTQTVSDAEFTEDKAPTDRPSEPQAVTSEAARAPSATTTVTASSVVTPPQNTNSKPTAAAQTGAIVRVAERPFEQQLEARNLTEAQWLAKSIAASRKIKDAGDENAVLLKLSVGRSLGMTLYQCLRMYLMEGQVVMRTQQVLARVKASSLCEYIRKEYGDDQSCTWVTKRRGEPEQKYTFTIAKARRAMLGGIKAPGQDFDPQSAWAKWPEDMLSARSVMPLMRQEYPEIADGYSLEELGEDMRDRTAIDTVGVAA